jgi:hypothetical protein
MEWSGKDSSHPFGRFVRQEVVGESLGQPQVAGKTVGNVNHSDDCLVKLFFEVSKLRVAAGSASSSISSRVATCIADR